MDQAVFSERLIDYLVFVGPGRGATFDARVPMSPTSSWHQVSCPTPTILNRFPATDHKDFELAYDMTYFCQPDGNHSNMEDPKTHIFMLTDTETNTRTYGVCLSMPHLFDPLLKAQSQSTNEGDGIRSLREEDDICIQEWGVLSVCLLSRHPFFNFFSKCLRTLAHFVEDFGDNSLSWKELIMYKPSAEEVEPTASKGDANTNGLRHKHRMLSEVVEWIVQLLALRAPEPGSALEVELEVDPALIVAYPSSNRLPLFELSIHQVFKRLDVCTVIDIYKLVLSEQKVIVHSSDGFFASECVLSVLALLYPLQYLFPLIPLLPTSMPTAENLLMVPTPFFIGVCTSFLLKVHEVHLAEIWTINLDTKEVHPPVLLDQPLLEFPYSMLQLQADIRRALDKLETADKATPSNGSRASSLQRNVAVSPHTSHTLTHVAAKLSSEPHVTKSLLTPQAPLGEDSFFKHFGDDIDVMIRVSFVDFLFSAEIIGLIDQYLCIYRLFPRPVVSLRKSSFLKSYEKAVDTVDTKFVRGLMQSQCIEYFLEWSLNPTNAAFEEIRRGVHDISRLSDKQFHYIHHQAFKTKQICLYNSSPDSLLYQEMLTYKATQSSFHIVDSLVSLPEEDDSDWEYLANSHGDHYDGGSESSPSYFSDEEHEMSLSPLPLRTRRQLCENGGVASGRGEEVDYLQDDIEVGYLSTRKVPTNVKDEQGESPSPVEERVDATPSEHTGDLASQKERRPRPKSLITTEATPTSILATAEPRRSMSCENLSPTTGNSHIGLRLLGNQFDASSAYLTSREYLTPHAFDTDTDHTHRDDSPSKHRDHSVFTSDEDELVNTHKKVNILDDGLILTRKLGYSTHKRPKAVDSLDDSLRSLSSNTSSDMLEFETPMSTLPRQWRSSSIEEGEGQESHGQVARTILALSALNNSQTIDNQIVDIVTKVVAGQGIPWLRSAPLKRLAGYEKTRVVILRHLEERLGVRTSSEVVMATNAQISHVGVTRAVYRGVLDLLKLLLQCVEEDFQKEPEGPLFSVFLILRISFTIYYEPKQKSTLGFSLRSALSVGSSFLGHTDSKPPGGTTPSSWNDSSSQLKRESMPSLRATRSQPRAGSVDSSLLSSRNGVMSSGNFELSENSTPANSGTAATDNHNSTSFSTPNWKNVSSTPGPRTSSPLLSHTKAGGGTQANINRSPSPSRGSIKRSHLSSIMQDDLMTQLVNSPRFFHPIDGQDLKSFSFLYKELLRGQGDVKPFLLKKDFWNIVFMSTISTDRGYLGWNERTADLYRRYKILPESHRRSFGSEEDNLLSIIAHNLLVYMLMVGLTAKETMDMIQGFTARTRLSTLEERLLQQTIKHVEQNVSAEIDLSDLGLMALYSEIHPTVSYIVHYGINMIAPVYKLQITDEALILRRFPDEKISARLWNDCITLIEHNENRATVSVKYRDSHGEFAHHFHTKQFLEVYNSLQALVVSIHSHHGDV